MQEFIRFTVVLLIAFFLLFTLVQCRSVMPETIDRSKRSLTHMCMFRKTRLCDYLRQMENTNNDQSNVDQELWKRGVSHFYSNW